MTAIRKSVTSLSAQERTDYVNAVKLMKKTGRYDWYVRTHVESFKNGAAHQGPAFLPWHRQFLQMFESDLRTVLSNPNFGLPYWDWAADQSSGKPWSQWSIWSEDFMGGNGDPARDNKVQTGPFREGQWTTIDDPTPGAKGVLQRNFAGGFPHLPTQADVASTLQQQEYDAAPWSGISTTGFRNYIEGFAPNPATPNMHNRVHVWIGGSMGPSSSPNDPVFFLHHANTDRLWSLWQAANPDKTYVPTSGARPGHNLNDEMSPWNAGPLRIKPADVLNTASVQYQTTESPYVYWSVWGASREHKFGKWNYGTNTWDMVASNWDVLWVAAAKNGDKWCVGTQNNLGKWDPATNKWVGQSSNWSLLTVAVNSKNEVYGVNTQHKLGKWDPSTGNFDPVPPSRDMWMVAFDADDTMWITDTDNTICKFDGTKFVDQLQMRRPWNSIAFDPQGRLWAFYAPQGTLWIWNWDEQKWHESGWPIIWSLTSLDFQF
ncbi:MAG TPA: tyrosinase family protein [Oculatellaceae cyanobacterium]